MGLLKFGTEATGFTDGKYGPFECSRCKYAEELTDYHICTNELVGKDSDVPEDKFGNKKINGHDCCNNWTPVTKSEKE